ncbi:MAG TPA: carboxypeptidase-like regulatory domain-containing protein [Planctomycetota bacterium]
MRSRTKLLLFGGWCFGLAAVALGVAWLRRGMGVIEGRVVDGEGRPIQAGVWRYPMDWYALTITGTDPDGGFSVLIPAEECRLVATHADWSESEPVLVPAGTKRLRDVTLRLRRPARVSGRALDPEGAPLVGAVVTVSSGFLIANDGEPRARSDEQGRFEIPVCDVGRASVWASDRERALGGMLRLDLEEGDVVEVELRCGRVSTPGELPELPGRFERAR